MTLAAPSTDRILENVRKWLARYDGCALIDMEWNELRDVLEGKPLAGEPLPPEEPPEWALKLAKSWREAARIARRNGHHGTAKKHEAFADELLAAAGGKS